MFLDLVLRRSVNRLDLRVARDVLWEGTQVVDDARAVALSGGCSVSIGTRPARCTRAEEQVDVAPMNEGPKRLVYYQGGGLIVGREPRSEVSPLYENMVVTIELLSTRSLPGGGIPGPRLTTPLQSGNKSAWSFS